VQIPVAQVPAIIRTLEHFADYMKATNRDDGLYGEVAESLKRTRRKAGPPRFFVADSK
jgi:hypothetical protein